MDYPCDKIYDCTFSHFGFIVWTNTQTHTGAAKRFTLATVVGVSNNHSQSLCRALIYAYILCRQNELIIHRKIILYNTLCVKLQSSGRISE